MASSKNAYVEASFEGFVNDEDYPPYLTLWDHRYERGQPVNDRVSLVTIYDDPNMRCEVNYQGGLPPQMVRYNSFRYNQTHQASHNPSILKSNNPLNANRRNADQSSFYNQLEARPARIRNPTNQPKAAANKPWLVYGFDLPAHIRVNTNFTTPTDGNADRASRFRYTEAHEKKIWWFVELGLKSVGRKLGYGDYWAITEAINRHFGGTEGWTNRAVKPTHSKITHKGSEAVEKYNGICERLGFK